MFPISNLSNFQWIFFKLALKDEWFGLVVGQILFTYNRVKALDVIKYYIGGIGLK